MSGDYYNFITGTDDDLSIKRVVDTAENTEWLIGKSRLFAGTTGSATGIRSADNNGLITAGNITTLSESVYGSASIQAVLANDVILYVQKNGIKVREMVYNFDEDNFQSNDLTILSESITDSGVVEMFLQKQPDQNVWAIKDDGELAILTYERGQKIAGWSRFITDGEVISGCALPSASGEDVVWLIVKRLGKYLLEKFHPRADLDWYVDSAVEFDGGACQTATSIDASVSSPYKVTVTKALHGLSNGDLIRIENATGLTDLNAKIFQVADKTTNDFILKTEDGSEYINFLTMVSFNPISISGAGLEEVNGEYNYKIINGSYGKSGNDEQELYTTGSIWKLEGESLVTKYFSTSSDIFPPTTGWTANPGVPTPVPTISYDETWTSGEGGDFCLVQNSLSGLDHLEGETVQVVADGSYHSDQVVSSGSITVDYANTIVAGLRFDSILRPMPIEPVLADRLSMSRKKAVSKVSVKLYNTIGAKIGQQGKQLTNHPAVSTTDAAGETIDLETAETRVFIASDWKREKVLEIKQDLPYPMTVLSMSVWVRAEGG